MGYANVLFETTKFPQEYEEGEGDSAPPPGRELNAALAAALGREPGCSTQGGGVGDDHWEHSEWYFWLTHGQTPYDVALESALDPERKPGLWGARLSRQRGVLKALFTRPKPTDLPPELQQAFSRVLQRVADARKIRWVSDEEMDKSLHE